MKALAGYCQPDTESCPYRSKHRRLQRALKKISKMENKCKKRGVDYDAIIDDIVKCALRKDRL